MATVIFMQSPRYPMPDCSLRLPTFSLLMQATAQAGSAVGPGAAPLCMLEALAVAPSALRHFHASPPQPSAAAAAAEPEPVPHAVWEEAELTSAQLTPRQARRPLVPTMLGWACCQPWPGVLSVTAMASDSPVVRLRLPSSRCGVQLAGSVSGPLLMPLPAAPRTLRPSPEVAASHGLPCPAPAVAPPQVVEMLDRYIVGQGAAKKAVANALRNRWRRHKVPSPLRVSRQRPAPAGRGRRKQAQTPWLPCMPQPPAF